MASPVTSPQDICSICGATLAATLRHCPTCQADAGAPNVRFCRTDENLKALTERFEDSRTKATAIGCSKEFITLEAMIKEKSGVVISMPASVARNLFEDPNFIFANYEQLVGANIRRPADTENDRHRFAVGGLLFGSYADFIVYGVLSLTGKGLSTYGAIHCRLRPVTIDKRTSFLETNSFKFVRDHYIAAGDKLPIGYMSCWRKRHELVLAKLANRLSKGQTESDWQAILINSDGQNRENDDFIEAHIYENFDKNAVESMVVLTDKKLSREEKLDSEIVIENFKRLIGKTT
jgi:hypothetical protein